MNKKNKKGFVMSLEAVLLIILAITVMTILLVFLATQTSFFKRFVSNQQDKSNIDVLVSKCNSLLDTGSEYSYCCEKREVNFGKKVLKQMTCSDFQKEKATSGRVRFLDCSGVECAGHN